MRFVVLVYQDEHPRTAADGGPSARVGHADLPSTLRGVGVDVVRTEVLHGTEAVTTFRRRGADVILTDGPAPDRPERLGAVVVLDAPDVDAVTGALGQLPEDTLEIHPVAAS